MSRTLTCHLCLSAAMAVASACTDGRLDEIGSAAAALTPVRWTNAVGVSTAGYSLTKTDPGALWNAGASTIEGIGGPGSGEFGNGFIEFTTGEATTDKMAGLGNTDASQHYADIEFAIRLNANGNVSVYESGTRVFVAGSYSAGDRFRVQVLDGVVTYWQNGALFYTSAGTPIFPLFVDTSLRTPGATLQEVQFEFLRFWTAGVGVHVAANDLVKTDTATTWRAGAISVRTITGDGAVEFSTREATAAKVAGLGNGNSGATRNDVEFGIYLQANGVVRVLESGVSRGTFGRYAAGDVFRVEVTGGVVSYRRNGVSFYTSSVAPSFPLVLDTSLRDPGATIEDGRVEACPLPVQTFVESVLWPRRALLAVDAAVDLMVVGDPNASDDSPPNAAVYRQIGGAWELEQVLVRSDGTETAMGAAVATDGTTIVVGSSFGDNFVQIFRRVGGSWVREARFSGCFGGDFGTAVAVQGDRVVVGQPGMVHVFRRNSLRWVREAILEGPSGESDDFLGWKVAIAGDRLFAGAFGDDTGGLGAGAVYVFRRDISLPDPGTASCDAPTAGQWQEEAVLLAPGGSTFGSGKLDTNATGTLLVAGHPSRNGIGAAYLFRDTGSGWSLDAELTPSHGLQDDEFGASVAFGGADPDAPDLVVVGELATEVTREGEVYVYRRSGETWNEEAWLRTPGPSAGVEFGRSVAATADQFIVAERGAEVALAYNRGSVYVYDDELTCSAP